MFGLSELKKTRVYQEGREEERQEAIEDLLKTRFPRIDQALAATIPVLMELPRSEAFQIVLNSSREEIIDRFSPKAGSLEN